MQNLIAWLSLGIALKGFIRGHLDNVLYGQAFNAFFHEKLESVIYNTWLTSMSAVRGTSTEKSRPELR